MDVTPIDEDTFRFTVATTLWRNVQHPVSYVFGVHRPATGQREILGEAQRGETLRVDIWGIEDRFGTPGADTLTGTDQIDTIFGGAGNDVLVGGHGDDTLKGRCRQ